MYLIAEEGPGRGLVLNLETGDEWVIGRDPESCTFVIEDNTVSKRHVRLTRSPEGIYLKNLSRATPTLINDEPPDGQILLKGGDRVQIGQTVFLFSEEEIAETPAPPKKEKKGGGYDDIFGSLEEPSEDLSAFKSEEDASAPSKSNAYDTIFEDAGVEAELPFNLLSDTPLLLKVISGPNAGAEIGLEKGRTYTIGKDSASSDIVFQDLSVSRNHARLHISTDGTVEIEDLGSKNGTVINGTPILEKKIISTQDLISLGTTVFLIVDREAAQETIYSPMVPSYEQIKAPELYKAQEAEPLVIEEKKREWKKEPIPPKILIAAASFAAMFLIIFLSFFSLFKSKQLEVAHKNPSSQIKTALAKFDGVQFSFNPASGKLFLAGHVLTGVEAEEMRYRIGEFDFVASTEDHVIVDEMVDKMMNDVLSGNSNFRGVTIQALKPGRFVLSGYLETNDLSMQLTEYLSVNFPYLDRLENQLVIGENLNAQIQSLFQMKGFGALSFQYVNGELVLSGNYSEKMGNEFKDLMKQLDAIQGVSGIKNYAIATTPNQAAIDVSQQFQVSGTSQHDGHGFSVVLNGKIYTVGDAVGGMAITEIDPSTILLEKDGIKYKINYTR